MGGLGVHLQFESGSKGSRRPMSQLNDRKSESLLSQSFCFIHDDAHRPGKEKVSVSPQIQMFISSTDSERHLWHHV